MDWGLVSRALITHDVDVPTLLATTATGGVIRDVLA
jgi:hypothetical protein